MLIEFRASDRTLSFKALGIYSKGVEAAKAACDKVYADTMALQGLESNITLATRWLGSHDEMEPGEARDVEVAHDIALTLRTAASIYLTQLNKLAEKETDLLVPLNNTNELASQLRSLADRLSGQTEINAVLSEGLREVFDGAEEAPADADTTITFSHGGKTSKPITMREMERRVDSLKR